MQDEFIRLQSVLRKTIVFITHDFDEAIRLADRIAIMKDGAVVQTGTPEDLVLRPADAYVAEFTRGVSRSKVVRVASVMQPGEPASGAPSVMENAPVAEAAPLFADGVEELCVTGRDKRPVGRLSRQAVADVMMLG
jgi:glycine betaine/proline transport system ATP-binding protein